MRISDWSSDVCSSDLAHLATARLQRHEARRDGGEIRRLQANQSREDPVTGGPARDAPIQRQYRGAHRSSSDREPARTIHSASARVLKARISSVSKSSTEMNSNKPSRTRQTGRASCRARVCQYVENSVVADSIKKKKSRQKMN